MSDCKYDAKISFGIDNGSEKDLTSVAWLNNDGLAYINNDITITNDCIKFSQRQEPNLNIEKVIFNGPATIVFWTDGTKTMVKCSDDELFDAEKGLAMAICKRALGSKFRKVFKEYTPEEEGEKIEFPDIPLSEIGKQIEKYKKSLNELLFLSEMDTLFKKD